MKRRIVVLLLLLCMTLAMLPVCVAAESTLMQSGNLDTASPTKDQIRAKWAEVTTAERAGPLTPPPVSLNPAKQLRLSMKRKCPFTGGGAVDAEERILDARR